MRNCNSAKSSPARGGPVVDASHRNGFVFNYHSEKIVWGSIHNWLGHDATTLLKTAGFAAIFAAGLETVTTQPQAAQLHSTVRQGQGATTELSAHASAITYWVNEADAWRVVTTVDIFTGQSGDSNNHAIVRFSSVLLPGQSQIISVPVTIGERQPVLRIRRLGDRLEIERIATSG